MWRTFSLARISMWRSPSDWRKKHVFSAVNLTIDSLCAWSLVFRNNHMIQPSSMFILLCIQLFQYVSGLHQSHTASSRAGHFDWAQGLLGTSNSLLYLQHCRLTKQNYYCVVFKLYTVWCFFRQCATWGPHSKDPKCHGSAEWLHSPFTSEVWVMGQPSSRMFEFWKIPSSIGFLLCRNRSLQWNDYFQFCWFALISDSLAFSDLTQLHQGLDILIGHRVCWAQATAYCICNTVDWQKKILLCCF